LGGLQEGRKLSRFLSFCKEHGRLARGRNENPFGVISQKELELLAMNVVVIERVKGVTVEIGRNG
jgi:hypothetical protein